MFEAHAIDILFEMEKRIGIDLDLERATKLVFKRSSGDVTMRELHEFICSHAPACR